MSAPAPAPATVVVVDARFCEPRTTAFEVTKTISITGHDFTVTNAAGAAVMQVEAAAFSFPRRSLLLDAASRRPVLTLQDQSSPMSSCWEAFRGDSTSRRRSLLFVTAKASPVQLIRTRVNVFLAGNNGGERPPDFVVRGSYHDGVCAVYATGDGNSDSSGDAAIAQITRQNTVGGGLRGFGGRTYTAKINPGVDQAFVLALTVMLHEMHD